MRSRLGLTTTLILGLLAWASVGPSAQAPPVPTVTPFDNVGFIDAATVDNPNDVFSGGTITMNGALFIVPRNTLLQLPAFALTWQEVFAKAPAAYQAAHQSGMARTDVPRPATTFEIHIQGNRVVSGATDQSIVGLMFMAQQSLNNGAGFINFIDYATGEMRVGGTIGDRTTGARVRINDPIGRHGLATDGVASPALDVRFQQDEDNPTVRTETGYPLCVPRVAPSATADDPLCPQKNRPKGTDGSYLTIFTTDFTQQWIDFGLVPGNFVGNGSDPLLMAPFEVGDYVDYSGALLQDGTGQYVAAHQVIANLGIFTQPGSLPTYMAIDVMLLGTGGVQLPNLPQEAAVRTRMEGFTTDPSSFVDLYAVDVDPCTGLESLRYYATVGVDPGPPTGAKAGRWRWRPSADAPFLPPTRMLRAISENGTYIDFNTGETSTPNGLKDVGQYSAPNFEFIFPENLGIGATKVPNNFQDFPFLAFGSGQYFGAVPGPVSLGNLGQLSPWPGASAPVKPLCPADGSGAIFSPIADAGPNQTAKSGDTVTINAAGSRDTTVPTPQPLTFSWSQVPTAPATTLTPATRVLGLPIGFSAPSPAPDRTFRVQKFQNNTNIPNGTVLTFQVNVSNGVASSSSTMTITIVAQPAAPDVLTGATAIFRIRRSRLDVTVTTSNPNAVLTVLGFGVMGPALPIAPGVPAPLGDRLYRQVGVNPIPDSVTIRSSLGGIVTVPVTVRP
jgi:hypothetical protein